MKIKTFLVLSILLTCLARSAPGADNLTNVLQNALFEEEANHNLSAAVQAYQTIIARSDEQRKLAATAMFRLAECYSKLGQTNDANAQYRRVLRDFSDQTSLVDLSRMNLGGVNHAPSATILPGDVATFDIVADGKVYHATTEFEAKELSSTIAQTKDSPDLVNAVVNGTVRLVFAADRDYVAVAEYLLDHGSDVEGHGRIPPLVEAARLGHKGMVQMLLDHGAIVDSRGPGDETALEEVSHNGYIAVAEVLAGHGAKINDTENGSLTPLIQALEGDQLAMVKFLLAHGADVNAKDSEGNTPLILAARGVHPDQTRLSGERGMGPAGFSVERSRIRWGRESAALTKIIALLVANHADVNATNHIGQTALDWIALVNAPDTMKLLLTNKAVVNILDVNKATSLYYAVVALERTNVVILLDHGADPNLKDKAGGTPLSWLIERNSLISLAEQNSAQKIRALLVAQGAVAEPLKDPEPVESKIPLVMQTNDAALSKSQLSKTSGIITVLGEVQKPGVVEYSSDRKMTLPEAIARVGGLTKTAQDMKIKITRGKKQFTFDLRAYLRDPAQYTVSPNLEDGDLISVSPTTY